MNWEDYPLIVFPIVLLDYFKFIPFKMNFEDYPLIVFPIAFEALQD